jgi:hypothetical protein
MYKLKKYLKKTLKFLKREKFRGPKSGDAFLCSYPRSGSTWVRLILSYIKYEEGRVSSLKDLDKLIPDIYRGIPKDGSKKIIKTHNSFGNRKSWSCDYDKVIYLSRNPVNVINSYYDYIWNIDPVRARRGMGVFVESITSGSVWPGSWHEHVTSWCSEKEGREFIHIRYEDLINNDIKQIKKLAKFLGKNISSSKAKRISKLTSRSNMINLEKKGSIVSNNYKFIGRKKEKRMGKREINSNMKKKIIKRSKRAMEEVGYENEEIMSA